MKKIIERAMHFKRISLFLCGIIAALPLVVPQLFVFSFIGLFSGFYLFHSTEKRRYSCGFFFFFAYQLTVYSFLISMYPLETVGFSPIVTLLILLSAWLALSALHAAICALIFPLTALICKRRGGLCFALVTVSFWVLFELLLEQGALGFPWSRICIGQYLFKPYIQSASLLGSLFVSFITVFISVCAAMGVKLKKLALGIISASVLVCNIGFGIVYPLCLGEGKGSLKVSTIQGNILSGEKWEADSFDKIYSAYVDVALDIEGSDIIVLPETALPVFISEGNYYAELYSSIAAVTDSELIAGAFTLSEDSRQQNSVLGFDEDGITGTYSKRHLVPFGEYLPFKGVLEVIAPFLADINQLSSDLAPGKDSAIFEAAEVKVGALVCFDSAFAPLARDAAEDGAELMVLCTNDSWFKDSAATTQHLAQSVFRALENRRSVVISANSGISAFIAPDGSLTSSLGALKAGVLSDEVSIRSDFSPYTLWGDVPVCMLSLVCIVFAVIFNVKERRDEKRRSSLQQG